MNKNLNKVLVTSAIVLVSVAIAVEYKTSKWKCRYCGEEFKPPFGEYFFAAHTPTRRKLTCPICGNKGYFKSV